MTAENRLFATLDPTTRRLRLGGGREVLLTDTVGFIQKLPTDLVAAFRATLEEATHADIVLHVLDINDPALAEHAETVEEVLGQLEAAGKPRVVALNKIDLLGPQSRRRVIQEIRERYPKAIPISATSKTGLTELLEELEIVARQDADAVDVQLLVPYGRESVLNDLRQVGAVERTEYVDAGTRAWGWVPRRAAHRFAEFSADS